MKTDYHSHILPKLDDGAKTEEMSMEMLTLLKEQGIERVVATPHFYAHKEKSVADFLQKRQKALDCLKASPIEIIPAAEVAVEHGISEIPGIEKLAITGTNLILLELPYMAYAGWMTEEIYNISCEYRLKPIIAHVHRCLAYYSKSEMEQLLKTDAVFQVNNEAFRSFHEKNLVKQLIKQKFPIVFGSDCHNISSRKPNFDLLFKKVKSEVIAGSDSILEQYSPSL